MTPDELINQANTAHEAATPGPWEPIDDYDGVASYYGWRGLSCPSGHGGHGGDGLVFATHEWDVGLKGADIEFIAAARTLVPALAEALQESAALNAVLLGRHQVASIAVASGLNPDATLDELYEHLAELRDG